MRTKHFKNMSLWKGLLLAITFCPMWLTAEPFSVSLKTQKHEYFVGEPVVATATIEYTGPHALEFNDPRDPGQYIETVEIAPLATDPNFRKFFSRAEAADSKTEREPFPPVVFHTGTKVERTYFMHGWPKDFAPAGEVLVFPRAGDYVIRLSARFSGEAASDETVISIKEPVLDADKEAWQWLQENDRLAKFCELDMVPKENGDSAVKEQREKLLKPFEDLVKKFPDSVYAKYARSVGGNFFDPPPKS